jgi:hypothetical protein
MVMLSVCLSQTAGSRARRPAGQVPSFRPAQNMPAQTFESMSAPQALGLPAAAGRGGGWGCLRLRGGGSSPPPTRTRSSPLLSPEPRVDAPAGRGVRPTSAYGAVGRAASAAVTGLEAAFAPCFGYAWPMPRRWSSSAPAAGAGDGDVPSGGGGGAGRGGGPLLSCIPLAYALRGSESDALRTRVGKSDSLDSYDFGNSAPPAGASGGEDTHMGYVRYSHAAVDVPVEPLHAPTGTPPLPSGGGRRGTAQRPANTPAFEVLLDCLPSGAPPDRVQVVLHRKYCRMRRDDIEKGIEAEWNRLTALEPRMWWYDGTMFRLASSQRWLDVDGTQEVKLECGITRYRSFLGTNMAGNWESIPDTHLSNPLSCFVLVHTSDRYVMLVAQPEHEGSSSSCSYRLPGGHLSADRAGIFESMVHVPIPDQDGQEVNCMLGYSIWPGSERWRGDVASKPRPYQNVVQEIFSCPVREACADLGLLESDFLGVPLLFGITQGRKNRIMSAVFYLATHSQRSLCRNLTK